MKRLLNLSIALILLLGVFAPVTANGEVTILWAQLPGGDNRVVSVVGGWIVADDFEFTTAATIGQVEFWSPTLGPVEVNVVFYTNTTNSSGYIIPDGVSLYSDSSTSTGTLEDPTVCSQLYCTYRHTLVLDTPLLLDPGHYWVAIYGTTELILSYDANITANSMAHFWNGTWISDSRNLAFRMLEPEPVCPETIEVTNTNNAGAGSLRQALVDVCAGGTITFNASLSNLSIILDPGAQLTLDKNVTIDASALAERVAITTDSMGRVMQVNSGVTAVLNSLKIRHGNTSEDGGGIYNQGNLTLINGVLLNNLAGNWGGGIYNTGTLTITDSSFVINYAYYGGGIFNNGGSVTVTNSSFNENSSGDVGGGIYNATAAGTLTVINSTLAENTSSAGGGIANESGSVTVTGSTLTQNSAVHMSGSGGGLLNGPGGTMTVANTTLSGNSAGNWGGGIVNYGTLNLTNSTLSGNSAPLTGGGGIANMESMAFLHFANTIIANSPSGGDCINEWSGAISTNTNNLVEDGSCAASLSGDPMLADLADNGGPTWTMALLAGSPAFDAGDDATCAAEPVSGKDQRGVTRPQGAHCDIGAYEKVIFTIFLPMIFR